MKIDFSKQLNTKFYSNCGVYALTNSSRYGAAIHDWNQAAEIINVETGLVIGIIKKNGARFEKFGGEFSRCWGFRKDLGKNGKVLKSAIK